MWSDTELQVVNLKIDKEKWENSDFKRLGLKISDKMKKEGHRLEKVRASNNPNILSINMVHTGDKEMTVFLWDIESDCEISSYSVQAPYQIAWDSHGRPIILN